jgi:hypothetical protein
MERGCWWVNDPGEWDARDVAGECVVTGLEPASLPSLVLLDEEWALAEKCIKCMAAVEGASVETQVSLRLTQRLHGFVSSHLTLAMAHERHACETRPAPGEVVVRRRFLGESLSWLATWRLSRSLRANDF